MEFTELPRDWRDLPLTDDLAQGIIDLSLKISDRESGVVLIMILNEDDLLMQSVVIDDVPADADPAALAEMLTRFLEDAPAGLRVIIALGRDGAPFSTPSDRHWANTCRRALTTPDGCQLRAFYLATPWHVRRLVLGAAGRDETPASA